LFFIAKNIFQVPKYNFDNQFLKNCHFLLKDQKKVTKESRPEQKKLILSGCKDRKISRCEKTPGFSNSKEIFNSHFVLKQKIFLNLYENY